MSYRALTAILIGLAIVGLLAITLAAVVVQRANAPPDALTAYHAIQPGADRSALHGFSCYDWHFVDMESTVCHLEQPTEPVRSIYVSLDNDAIRNVSLSVYGMRLDELQRRYGTPTRLRNRARFVWRYCYGDGVLVTVYGRGFGVVATHVSYSTSRQSC